MTASEQQPIRVAHIHAGKKMCGCAAYIFNLMEYMDPSEFECHLTLIEEGEVSEAAKARGIPYFVAGKSAPGDPRTFLRLKSYYKINQIDLVHTHTMNGNFYGRIAGLITSGTKVVTTVHTYMKKVIGDISGQRDWLGKCMLAQNNLTGKWTSAFIVASEALRQDIIEDGVPASKTHLVYNGIQLPAKGVIPEYSAMMRNEFGFDETTLVIGTAIRLVPSKNVQALIRGSAMLKAAGISHKTLIIGQGSEEATLKKLAADLDLNDTIVFAGWRSDARTLVAGLDLYVQPSLEENFPYGILEAMAMERPVLCFNTGSHPDMVSTGETGYVCGHGDQAEFEAKLLLLMNDHVKRLEFGRISRERVQSHFSDTGMATAMASVYRSVLSTEKQSVIATA